MIVDSRGVPFAKELAQRSESVNWPTCAICSARKERLVPVKAYGRVHEADDHLVYYTSCNHGAKNHRSEQEHRIEKPSLGTGQAEGSHWRRDQVRELRHTKP